MAKATFRMNIFKFKNTLFIISLIILLIFLGFLRLYFFVNINNQLKENLNSPIFLYPNRIDFIADFSNHQLMVLKWSLTVLFTLIYLLVSCYAVKFFWGDRNFVKITIAVYLFLVLASFVAMTIGYLFGSDEKAYTFSRYLMGIAQSPLVLMILIPAFYLINTDKKNPSTKY